MDLTKKQLTALKRSRTTDQDWFWPLRPGDTATLRELVALGVLAETKEHDGRIAFRALWRLTF